MGFFGMFNVYSLRTNLSVAIVAMVNTTVSNDSETNLSALCPDRGQSSTDTANSVRFWQNSIDDWGKSKVFAITKHISNLEKNLPCQRPYLGFSKVSLLMVSHRKRNVTPPSCSPATIRESSTTNKTALLTNSELPVRSKVKASLIRSKHGKPIYNTVSKQHADWHRRWESTNQHEMLCKTKHEIGKRKKLDWLMMRYSLEKSYYTNKRR